MYNGEEDFLNEQTLEGWVMHKCEQWRDHYDANYQLRFEEYYRLWRGIWSKEDSMRDSERSKIISPALQQAVESAVAEIEEATFGRGDWFDLQDDFQDEDKNDMMMLRKKLMEDMHFSKAKSSISEITLNAAIYGTGCGEIVVEEVKRKSPATQPIMNGLATAVGIKEENKFLVKLKPILPQNFLIDPVATCVEDALGVAIDEFVPRHQVDYLIANGTYKRVDICDASPDFDIEPDQDLTVFQDDKVRLIRYYGLVPAHLLEKSYTDSDDYSSVDEMEDEKQNKNGKTKKQQKEEEKELEKVAMSEDGSDVYEPTEMVEAVIVIANDGILLKAEENPYMMGDRPVVGFSWDRVPGRFWGRGICEKGYNSQKALDTELRARIDALALTIHPMMAVDASRLPRGSKLQIRPGGTILTNGNPAEILQPFRFGQLDQLTFAQSGELMKMVQMATGSIDASGLPAAAAGGEATAAGMSMSLGAIIKRHKRTLINFQEHFLVPFIEKAAWRYMQFAPEQYPVKDFKFVATSTLGIIAREYEVSQLVQLLQTMPQDSPVYFLILEKVVENMQISNREELVATMRKATEPNPQEQQMQQMQEQMKQALFKAELAQKQAQAAKTQAEAIQTQVETQLMPREVEAKYVAAISTNLREGEGDDREFERRMRVAELALKEKDIDSNERIVDKQIQGQMLTKMKEAEMKQSEDQQFRDNLNG